MELQVDYNLYNFEVTKDVAERVILKANNSNILSCPFIFTELPGDLGRGTLIKC